MVLHQWATDLIERDKSVPAAKNNARFRILVVDDDDSTRSFITSVLAAEGYECLAANSITSAESLLRQETVHLAFLDLYLGPLMV